MPDGRRHRKGGRTTPKATRPRPELRRDRPGPDRDAEPELLLTLRRLMAEAHPLGLLAYASSILNGYDPRNENPFQPRPAPRASWEDILASFLDVDLPETTAVLTALAPMVGDEMTAARIGKELAGRRHRLPRWLEGLAGTEAGRTVVMVDPLGDGDEVLVGARTPAGDELTVAVYIDHNLGSVLKDGFVVPDAVERVVALIDARNPDPDAAWRDLDGADARARITEAIDLGARTVPPYVSDTWPAARPLVEWVVGLLPPGGAGHQHEEWDEAAVDALAERFLASPLGEGLDEEKETLLRHLLWFGAGYGPGDPLHWSPVAVELVLLDWVPRKILAPAEELAPLPEVLRRFIRFCHDERGIRPDLTDDTLAAVDRWEPEYQRLIRSARLQGPAALLAAAGVLDDADSYDADHLDDEDDYVEVMLDMLRRAVGGADALRDLDDRPLPAEEFQWDGVAADIHSRVGEVLALCDSWCDAALDVEHRTACRRFLARVATADPAFFRRRSRAATAAAGVCWVVGHANRTLSRGPGTYVKDLVAHLGVVAGAPADRGMALLRAGGFSQSYSAAISLGTPDMLVSARRRRIIELRDRYLALQEG